MRFPLKYNFKFHDQLFMSRTIIILFLLVLIFNNSEAKTREISLKECIKIALQNHPDLMLAEEDKNKSVFQYKIARSIGSMQVNGSMRTVERLKEGKSADQTIKIPGKDTDIGLFAGLTASYKLYDPQKTYREQTSRFEIDRTKINELKKKNLIIFNVKKAYYDYIIQMKRMRLIKKIMDFTLLKNKQAHIQYKSGVISIVRLTSSEVELAEARFNYEKAKNKVNAARYKLYSSMGIHGKEDIDIYPVQFEKLPKLRFNLKDLFKLAQLHNPSIQLIKLDKNKSKLNINMQRALHKPSVSIIFSLGYENYKLQGMDSFNENLKSENWQATVFGILSASLPIYQGGGIIARENSAKADYKKAVYMERNTILSVKNSIKNLYKNLNELLKQVKMSDLIIKNRKKHLLLARSSYKSGIGSQKDVNSSELSVMRSELNHAIAIQSYLNALASLANTVGVSEDYICER